MASRKAVSAVTSVSRLGVDDWVTAAIDAIEQGGVSSIAVEPLAATLGTTKGSFYWHFRNRADLVTATLERWEQLATTAVIASVNEVSDPLDGLRLLLRVVFTNDRDARIEARIVLAPFDELTSPIVARVTSLRIEFLESMFAQLGFSRSVAVRRARIAYAAYLGHLRLLLDEPRSDEPPDRRATAAIRAYADELLQVLTRPT